MPNALRLTQLMPYVLYLALRLFLVLSPPVEQRFLRQYLYLCTSTASQRSTFVLVSKQTQSPVEQRFLSAPALVLLCWYTKVLLYVGVSICTFVRVESSAFLHLTAAYSTRGIRHKA